MISCMLLALSCAPLLEDVPAIALAQSIRPPPGVVGLRGDAAVGLRPGEAEVTVANGQQIGITPGSTVDLGSASLSTLAARTCNIIHRNWQSIGTTAAVVPTGGNTALRTAITLQNLDTTRRIACAPESTPTFGPPGLGSVIYDHGDSVTFEVSDGVTVRCIAETAGGSNNLAVVESICTPASLALRAMPKAAPASNTRRTP